MCISTNIEVLVGIPPPPLLIQLTYKQVDIFYKYLNTSSLCFIIHLSIVLNDDSLFDSECIQCKLKIMSEKYSKHWFIQFVFNTRQIFQTLNAFFQNTWYNKGLLFIYVQQIIFFLLSVFLSSYLFYCSYEKVFFALKSYYDKLDIDQREGRECIFIIVI